MLYNIYRNQVGHEFERNKIGRMETNWAIPINEARNKEDQNQRQSMGRERALRDLEG